jgi:hypothetical protein
MRLVLSNRASRSGTLRYLTPQDCLPDRQVKSAAGALHLALFEQPGENDFSSSLLDIVITMVNTSRTCHSEDPALHAGDVGIS